MNGHPGGLEHTRRMLELAKLPTGARVLDMGAGAGESVTLLRAAGFSAVGVDKAPRGPDVTAGDFLRLPYADGSFDAVLSQCAFFVSGDVPGALREARRVLRQGGKLLLSDVFFEAPEPLLSAAGFRVLFAEDMTPQWRDYYIEALWREDAACCELPRGKCSYWLLIGQKEGTDGSL